MLCQVIGLKPSTYLVCWVRGHVGMPRGYSGSQKTRPRVTWVRAQLVVDSTNQNKKSECTCLKGIYIHICDHSMYMYTQSHILLYRRLTYPLSIIKCVYHVWIILCYPSYVGYFLINELLFIKHFQTHNITISKTTHTSNNLLLFFY